MKITDEMIRRLCSETMYRRGTEYFSQGRVHINKRGDDGITAVVDGEQVYTVRIAFDGDKIIDSFCTCPYYATMQTPCKHIAATLKKYAAEEENGGYIDGNDIIALDLCQYFAKEFSEKKRLNASFSFNISTVNGYRFSAGISAGEGTLFKISNAAAFMDAYVHEKEYKLSKKLVYSPAEYFFGETETKVLDILAESYECRVAPSMFYSQSSSVISFPAATADRLFPLMLRTGSEILLNGVTMQGMRVHEDNPDIIVEISAEEGDVTITADDFGLAVVPDGEWFVFEGDLYRTDREWRRWYMPIYRALTENNRTQLHFCGENVIAFASEMLPKLRNRHGIEFSGIDELIVSARPAFEVYLDGRDGGISALVKASYGGITLAFPGTETGGGNKILVRDTSAETAVLSYFEGFDADTHCFILNGDEKIYDFLKYTIPELSKLAAVYASDSLKAMRIHTDVSASVNVSYNEKINLLETEIETDLSGDDIAGILSAVRLKQRFYRMKNGSFLDVSENGTLGAFELLDKLDFGKNDIKNGIKRISAFNAMYIDSIRTDGFVNADASFDSFVDRLRSVRAEIPPDIDTVLRGYQREGVNWLKQLSAFGFGGILADDMGLGKTLQVIAFVMSEKRSLPALIVTPSSLTYNWQNEITRFAPQAGSVIIDGTREERAAKLEDTGSADFVITSYPLLRRDVAMYREKEFSYMFIDEAQYIKNPKTMNARSVKRVKAGGYFALTGTPVENSLTELWSIFDYAMSGYLYSHSEFTRRFEKSILKENSERVVSELRRRIKPFVMRRMKSDVLSELPEKIENTMLADLLPEQRRLYDAYLMTAKSEAAGIMAEDGGRTGQLKILSLLMRLRQICCHPVLFDAAYKKDSGKLEMLCELAEPAHEAGHRLLIFSQFTSMLAIIKQRLEGMGLECFYIDGSTPSKERNSLAARFNGGEGDAFLVSLKAGGTGLNLTGADTVIHYDPWWNPAVMDQASDRAYRIGQTKAVQVIKLATRNTIEEKIIKLQDKKRVLADGVIQANTAMLSRLSREEILALFE